MVRKAVGHSTQPGIIMAERQPGIIMAERQPSIIATPSTSCRSNSAPRVTKPCHREITRSCSHCDGWQRLVLGNSHTSFRPARVVLVRHVCPARPACLHTCNRAQAQSSPRSKAPGAVARGGITVGTEGSGRPRQTHRARWATLSRPPPRASHLKKSTAGWRSMACCLHVATRHLSCSITKLERHQNNTGLYLCGMVQKHMCTRSIAPSFAWYC